MKKLYLLSFLLVVLAGCQVEELATQETNELPESKTATYYVGMEDDAETKTSSTPEGDILWSEGDRMNIFAGVNNDNKDKLTLMEGAGTKNGSFYGPYIATSDLNKLHQTVIVYPFDENNTCVANEDKTEYTVGLTIPAVQEYTEGSFANGAYPMIGVTEGLKEVVIETKNVCPVIYFRLTGEKTISKIVLSSDELALAGPSEVVVSHGANPVATVVPETASNIVELLCDGVQLSETPTEFHLVLAPCTGAIDVTIYDTEGSYTRRTLPSREYARNQRIFFDHAYTGENSVVADLKNAFKNGGEYTLPIDVTVSESLLIEDGKTLNLDLNGNTLTTIAELSGTSGCIQATRAELNITNGKIVSTKGYLFVTNGYNEKLHLELTDVDIVKTGGSAAFYFADGTDIVLNNVNVDTKNRGFYSFNSAPKGSIVISGGKYKSTGKMFDFKSTMNVSFFEESMFSDNSYTGVQWEETGDEVFPWKPVGHKVFVGSQGFYSLAEAVASVEESATVTVAADLELTETVTIPAGKTIVLDLAGNTVSQSKECTESYAMFNNNGTLTITGEGTLRFKDLSDGGSSDWGSYIINNKGTLVVENGTLEHLGTSDLSNHDTCIPIQNYAGKVTVNGGVISSPEFRSLRDFTAGGEIEINGGVFKGQIWMQGLGTGSSTLTIKGGEFAPTAGYDGSSIFITNGTNDVKVSIEGGKFNTKIGCTDASKEGVAGCITGGLFTESAKNNTNAGLLKSGLAFVESGDVDFPYALDYRIFANGVGYPSIQAAIDASVGGEVIEVAAGTYPQVIKVTGGKNLTIQPKEADTVVTIGGVDHQSNGTASTVVFNNITFDNSIQTAGWFTGTAQNIKPCVGAWGGNLSFNECTFNVAGTSGAETGVMTWWTTDKMSLSFKDCTFNGINDHASARAMQIYGNVDLNVDGCTFNTYKDYSLKYVGNEGTTAVLTNNIVNNTEYFVELGSSAYPGYAYVVTITGSTLGEGIEDYIVANVEEQIVNGVEYSKYNVHANGQKFETVAEALAGTTGDVEVTVKEGEYVLPAGLNQTSESRTVTIKGAGKDVTNLKGSAGGNNPGNYANGLDLKFEDITFTTANSGYSGGFGHAASVEFTNCKIVGQFYAHSGAPHKFTDCTIDPLNGYLYTYASDCDFVNCDFTASEGKALQVYEDSSTGENTVNITECRFTAAKQATTYDGKPVTGIDINSNGAKFTVNITNCTTTGFPTGLNSGTDLWNVKNLNADITVVVDGENVYPGYVKVSDNEYNVYSAKGLQYFSDKAQNDVTLNIMKDIDFNGAEFKAIVAGRGKSLIVNGNNHVIKNVKVVSGADDNSTGQASFFYTHSGSTLTVSDLKFDNIEVAADINGSGYAGAVVGYAEGNVILNNVDVTGADVYGEKSCGALVGYIASYGSAKLTNCDVLKSSVEAAEDRTGAYAGRAQGALTVVNCTVDSEFTSVAPDGWANLYIGQRYAGCPTCTIDGKEYVDAYYGLAAAIVKATDGAELIVADGTYEGHFDLTGKKNVTIEAINAEKAVINGMVWADNCNVTLKGLKLSNLNGVQHPNPSNSQYYATINTQYPLVGAYNNAQIKFDGCVFDLTGPTVYGFYGYAHNDPVFEGCTFNCNNIRPIANNGDSITVNGCTFNNQYHYSVRIFENSGERQTVVYTNNTVQGTNDKGEFEGVNISKKGSSATVYADFTITGNTSGLKYRHHKNVTMGDSCTYVGITGFEKEN